MTVDPDFRANLENQGVDAVRLRVQSGQMSQAVMDQTLEWIGEKDSETRAKVRAESRGMAWVNVVGAGAAVIAAVASVAALIWH